MKVCIIGAGISGLACAAAMEKYGVTPDIYEQYDRCGGRVPFIVCILQIMHRPVPDPLIDLAVNYGIKITPINLLKKIIRFSPNEISRTTGNLGYIFELGPSPRSVSSQLRERVSSPVIFNTVADIKKLASHYDKVVVASGSPFIAKELGLWSDIFRGWVRGAVMRGNFDPQTWIIWFNKNYANNGYAYLGPFNEDRATLVLAAQNVSEGELESHWKSFLHTEKINYREEDGFILEHITGVCRPKEIGNIIFTGNSAGLMESVFGFGLYNAIISGVMAAKSIVENTPYEKSISFLSEKLYHSAVLRKKLDAFENKNYDRLLGAFNFPPLNSLIYHTNLDVLKIHTKLSELMTSASMPKQKTRKA